MKVTLDVRKKMLDKLIQIGVCEGAKGRVVDFVKRVAPYYAKINS